MNMIGRRAFIARAFATLAFGTVGLEFARASSDKLDAEKLKVALRVTTDGQAKFIDDVVEKVEKGDVPE